MANYKLKTEITEHVAGMEVAPPSAPPAFNAYVGGADAAFVVADGDEATLYVSNPERPEWQGESAASSDGLLIDCWMLDAEAPDGKRYEEAIGAFGKLVQNAPLPRVTTSAAVTVNSAQSFKLPLPAADQYAVHEGDILLVCGMDGWDTDGATRTSGRGYMVCVIGHDINGYNHPKVVGINGPKLAPSAPVCKTPDIPAGTQVQVLPITAQDLNVNVKALPVEFVPALVEGLAGISARDLGLAEGIIRVRPPFG